MRYIQLSAFLFIFIFVSCSHEDKRPFDGLSEQIEYLKSEKIQNVNEVILNPIALAIIKESLLIYEDDIPIDIFKIFTSTDYNMVRSFGERGGGPREYSNTIAFPISIADKSELSIYDWSKKKVHRFIPSQDSIITKTNSYTLPPELMLTQKAAFLNDTTVLATGGINKGIMAFVATKSDSVIYFNPYEIDNKNLSDRQLAQIYRAEFAINFENETIAVATKYIPEIFVIDFKGNILQRIKTSNYDISLLLNVEEIDIKLQYQDISASKNYIYAVHINHSTHELGELLDKNTMPNYVTEVHVFNWQGEFIRKFILDNGYHPFITVDQTNHRMLSIDRFSTNGILYFQSENIK